MAPRFLYKKLEYGFDSTQLQGFGQTMHGNINSWYADTEESRLWRPLPNHITFIKNEKENDPMTTYTPFYGKAVAATGKLANYTRDGIQAKLPSLGTKTLAGDEFEAMLAGGAAWRPTAKI